MFVKTSTDDNGRPSSAVGFESSSTSYCQWCLNSQLTGYQSAIITITPKSQLWVGDTEMLPVTFQ